MHNDVTFFKTWAAYESMIKLFQVMPCYLVEVPENIFNKWQINIFQGCLCLCWNGNSGLIQFQHDTLASLQATAY